MSMPNKTFGVYDVHQNFFRSNENKKNHTKRPFTSNLYTTIKHYSKHYYLFVFFVIM